MSISLGEGKAEEANRYVGAAIAIIVTTTILVAACACLVMALPHFIGAWGVFLAESISDACSIAFCSALFAWRIPKVLRNTA